MNIEVENAETDATLAERVAALEKQVEELREKTTLLAGAASDRSPTRSPRSQMKLGSSALQGVMVSSLTAKEESQIEKKRNTAADVAKLRDNMKKALQKKVENLSFQKSKRLNPMRFHKEVWWLGTT